MYFIFFFCEETIITKGLFFNSVSFARPPSSLSEGKMDRGRISLEEKKSGRSLCLSVCQSLCPLAAVAVAFWSSQRSSLGLARTPLVRRTKRSRRRRWRRRGLYPPSFTYLQDCLVQMVLLSRKIPLQMVCSSSFFFFFFLKILIGRRLVCGLPPRAWAGAGGGRRCGR